MTNDELLRAWWPWTALASGAVVVVAGGILFSPPAEAGGAVEPTRPAAQSANR